MDDLRPITQLTANIANKQQTAEGDALEVPQGDAVKRFPQTVIPQPFGFSRSNLIGLDVAGLEDWTWEGTTYLWDAPDLCHAAVHFEETYVERCGHSWGLAQPLFSVLHY